MNEHATIGDNNPPGQIAFSRETVQSLSDWMKNHPVIQNEDAAREAKSLCDRASLCLKDMKDERDGHTRPLNDALAEIHARYREPHTILSRTLTELMARLNAFILREEEHRKQIAAEAQAKLEEAERLAHEAEEAEQKAIEEAKHGVADADVGALVRQADEKFSRFKDAANAKKRADRATKVVVGGGFRRATSLRNKEILTVDDAHAALRAMGLTDAIRATILTEARAFRTSFGALPEGVSSHKERG